MSANKGGGAGLIENAILLAGPTASGKSRLALELAAREGRTIVNADSMQVYSVLDLITARPDASALRKAPHRLYGHVHPAQPYSVGAWIKDVQALQEQGLFAFRPPIFVGGTGLYFKALTSGLSEMPPVPEAVRTRWRERLASEGPQRLHEVLEALDPKTAAVLRPKDGQRVVRALEILEASGRPISDWRGQEKSGIIDDRSAQKLVLEPDREDLRQRIEARFERMIAGGALDEAKAVDALHLDPANPAMKAIGLRELIQAARGEITGEAAKAQAVAATRRYAKRQATWFRHQLDSDWTRVKMGEASDLKSVG